MAAWQGSKAATRIGSRSVRVQPTMRGAIWQKAMNLKKVGERIYLVQTENGNLYRRNRKFLKETAVPYDGSKLQPGYQSEDQACASAQEPSLRSPAKDNSPMRQHTSVDLPTQTFQKTTEVPIPKNKLQPHPLIFWEEVGKSNHPLDSKTLSQHT